MSTENDKFAVAETRPKTKINDARRSKYKNGRLTTKRSKKTTRLSRTEQFIIRKSTVSFVSRVWEQEGDTVVWVNLKLECGRCGTVISN